MLSILNEKLYFADKIFKNIDSHFHLSFIVTMLLTSCIPTSDLTPSSKDGSVPSSQSQQSKLSLSFTNKMMSLSITMLMIQNCQYF
jgi:hypothetical protein